MRGCAGVDGRAYSWGDCDGDSLGHAVSDCHVPHRLTSLSGMRVAHGAVCYTNGAAALTDGSVFVWGGGMWQGGIGGGTQGPRRVGSLRSGVPACYEVDKKFAFFTLNFKFKTHNIIPQKLRSVYLCV